MATAILGQVFNAGFEYSHSFLTLFDTEGFHMREVGIDITYMAHLRLNLWKLLIRYERKCESINLSSYILRVWLVYH